jgi:hypothetical protein
VGVLLDRTVYGLIVGVTVGQNVGASDLSSVPIICLKKSHRYTECEGFGLSEKEFEHQKYKLYKPFIL